MVTANGKHSARAPGSILYAGETFVYAGRGGCPCSAAYVSQNGGRRVDLFYSDLRCLYRGQVCFRPHHSGLKSVWVAADKLAQVMATPDRVFIVGPVSDDGSSSTLRGDGAWPCDG
jgi:hypothetical protein